MNRLLLANIMRLKKNNIFCIGFTIMLLSGIIVPIIKYNDMKSKGGINTLDSGFLYGSLIIGIILSIFCSLFIGTEYSDGDFKIVLLESGEIIFSNNASGLNNVQVGQLFDRFYTVSVAKKSTGIGLSISKALVDKMGGNIMAKYIDSRLYIHVFFDNV